MVIAQLRGASGDCGIVPDASEHGARSWRPLYSESWEGMASERYGVVPEAALVHVA